MTERMEDIAKCCSAESRLNIWEKSDRERPLNVWVFGEGRVIRYSKQFEYKGLKFVEYVIDHWCGPDIHRILWALDPITRTYVGGRPNPITYVDYQADQESEEFLRLCRRRISEGLDEFHQLPKAEGVVDASKV